MRWRWQGAVMQLLRDLARWSAPRAARVAMTLLGGAAVIAIALAAAGCGGSSGSDVVVRAATATGTPAPSAAPSTSATATATPSETPIAGPVVTSIKELVAKYGYPPGANLARMRIPDRKS